MQSYLKAQESRRACPVITPHSSIEGADDYGNRRGTYTTSADPYDTSASVVASNSSQHEALAEIYTTPAPPQGGGVGPRVRGVSPAASYSSTCKAQTPSSITAGSVQLVQIKPNVWLPLEVVQEAGSDVDLALHLAAQTRPCNDTSDSLDGSPIAGKAWTPGTAPKPSLDDSSMFRQGQTESANNSRSGSHGGSVRYAPWANTGQHRDTDSMPAGTKYSAQYDSNKMQSHFKSALRFKADSIASSDGGQSKFDLAVQPPTHHMNSCQGVGGAWAAYQTAASKHSLGSAFRSSTASLPMMGSTGSNKSAYVSPGINNSSSLFSYDLATPEQTVHPRPGSCFATPEANPSQAWGGAYMHNPNTFNPAAYYPELNPSATHLHMGQNYGLGNFSGMADSPGAAGGALDNPLQDPNANHFPSHYADSSEMHLPQHNMAAGMLCCCALAPDSMPVTCLLPVRL